MKRWLFLGALFALFAGSAAASVTTYYWHQTSSTPAGVVIHGSYSWLDGSGPVEAHSDLPANFGGLVDLNISAPNMAPVTLADLVPPCDSCITPYWNLYADGSYLSLFYVNAENSESYDVNGYWIQAGSDEFDPCAGNICLSYGYWAVPAPASLPVFATALVLFGLFRVRSGRIRS